jgi:hypothetical protein
MRQGKNSMHAMEEGKGDEIVKKLHRGQKGGSGRERGPAMQGYVDSG